jgi:hypothetical protein
VIRKERAITHLFGTLFAVVAPVSLWGCGGSGDNGPVNPISGVMNVQQFKIAAGETRTVTGDLIVNSTDDLVIDGQLLVTPGARVALYSEKDVIIHGVVKPAPTRARSTREGEPPADLVIASRNVDISPQTAPFPVELAGEGGSALITTTAANGRVSISQEIIARRGKYSDSRTVNGGSGGNIEIGTQKAIDAAVADGKAGAVTPLTIAVTSKLQAGDGGWGLTDYKGIQTPGLFDLRGTDGGRGGDINLSAGTVTAVDAILVPGRGGPGGGADGPKAADGAAPGEKGSNLKAHSGSGGRGGVATVKGQRRVEGGGGKAGDIRAAAGNGGPGGRGGDSTIEVGAPGSGLSENEAVVSLVNGGNGGNAGAPFQNGGDGGSVVLTVATRHDGTAGRTAAVVTNSYGRGGNGYSGCTNPTTVGTNGGHGGSFTGPQSLYFPHPEAFVGGNAGDGVPPGVKGRGGTEALTGVKFDDGRPGVTCDVAALAVRLAHNLSVNGTVRFPAGTLVPFRDFSGVIVAQPDVGCDKTHPHAPGGFTINGVGPFDDMAPGGCGIGEFVNSGG